MRIAVFNTKSYDRRFFEEANASFGHELVFFETRCNKNTVVLSRGFHAICAFVNDVLDETVLTSLFANGVKLVALRCAGFNNVDLKAAKKLGISIVRVPAYSPHGVAEHAVGLMLALNRKIYKAHNRVRDGNLALEGLLGYEIYGKTVGVVGTGKIGVAVASIMSGFGCKVLGFDPIKNPKAKEAGVKYVSLDELLAQSDIITLHCPLMPQTHYIINAKAIKKMKDGVMLINTSRGALVETLTVIEALKSGKIGYLGLDVYEEEGDIFFEDLSGQIIKDDVFARLLTFPNVVVTGHQAFFTETALSNIAHTTLENISEMEKKGTSPNLVTIERHKK